MNKKEIVLELVRIKNHITDKEILLQKAVGGSYFILDNFDIENLILDILNIPKDATVEAFEKYGLNSNEFINAFCRDGLVELVDNNLEELFKYAEQYE